MAAVAVAVPQKKEVKRGFWVQLWRLPRAWVGAFMVAFMILSTILLPVILPLDPLKQHADGVSEIGAPLPPNANFPFGTDHLGRDLFSRLLYGGRVSLLISLAANLTAAVLGTVVGF